MTASVLERSPGAAPVYEPLVGVPGVRGPGTALTFRFPLAEVVSARVRRCMDGAAGAHARENAGSRRFLSSVPETISARRSRSSTATNLKAMAEPSPTPSRIADVDVTAQGWPWEALEDLEAQELRLYALGWGDHLPVELRERIEMIRRRKLVLAEHMLAGGEPRVTIDEDLDAG